MLNYEFPPIGGGAGNAHLCLLRQFAGRGDLKVDVLTSAPKTCLPSGKGGLLKERFSENIMIYKVGLHKKDLHFWRRAEVIEWLAKAGVHYRRLLRENQYDLVHAFFGFPTGWLCYRSAGKVPYVISLRGSDVPGRHARLKLDYKVLGPLVFKRIWESAAALVACSEGLRKRALAFLPTVAIEVIPNGVDLERFYPADSKSWGLGKQLIRLLTVGRLSITKRVKILIEAVDILSKDGYDVHLAIVGGGALEGQLKSIVAERNLGEVVETTGRIEPEDMPRIYRENDIFVSASMQEGMSNAMLEAMASGLPIVTTRCEGVDELIADNGIVVDKPQADEIANVIRRLAENREICRRMSQASRERAALFSWSSVANQYIKCYQVILGH
jgi:glycosyltransferase involved in cell wall biosynthesis